MTTPGEYLAALERVREAVAPLVEMEWKYFTDSDARRGRVHESRTHAALAAVPERPEVDVEACAAAAAMVFGDPSVCEADMDVARAVLRALGLGGGE